MSLSKVLRLVLALALALPLLSTKADATVASPTTWVQYTLGSNPQTLTVPFVFQSSTDLIVYDTRASADPVTLTLNSDYSVSGGSGSAGTVTTIAGGANGVLVGDVITIARNVPLTQTTTFSNSGPLTASMIGNSLDKLTEITQQLNERSLRSLQFGPDETQSGVLSLTGRENSILAFDGTGKISFLSSASAGQVALNSQALIQATGTTTPRSLADRFAQVFNVKDFNAKGDGVTDDTVAIAAANAAACVGTLGLDGVTVISNGAVFFPPGSYKFDHLVYTGAPWVGSGMNNTFLYPTGATNTATINAVGTNSARKIVQISDMTIDGVHAAASSYALRLGYNQRSFGAIQRVRIQNFPGPALYFKNDTWEMSFYDTYIYNCATTFLGSAIYVDSAVVSLLDLEFHNLMAENNGSVSSGVGGAAEFPSSVCQNIKFFGGTTESNYGAAEMRFTDVGGVTMVGVYNESDPSSVTDGYVFAGVTVAKLVNPFNVASAAQSGHAYVVKGTAKVAIDAPRGSANWATALAVQDTAVATLTSDGTLFTPVTVASGATFNRLPPAIISPSESVLVSGVDVTTGNQINVTLTADRAVGAPLNPSVGQQIIFNFLQDGTGGHAVTWNAAFKVSWSNTGNTNGKRSSIAFTYNGTNWVQTGSQSPYL